MAKKGGALPEYEALELIRVEGGVPVRRFVARLGIPVSTWYHWRAGHLHGRPVRRWPAPVVDAIEEQVIMNFHNHPDPRDLPVQFGDTPPLVAVAPRPGQFAQQRPSGPALTQDLVAFKQEFLKPTRAPAD